MAATGRPRHMIVFYNPRSLSDGRRRLPLSLLSLVRMFDDDCAIVDGNVEQAPVDKIKELFRQSSTENYLAVSVMPGPQLVNAIQDTRAIKNAEPDVTTIWGGYFPSIHPRVTLTADYVDYVVSGQGELTFKELHQALEAGDSVEGIPGISYRRNGTVQQSSPRSLRDVNSFRSLPYHLVDVEKYVVPTYLGSRTLCHVTSAGCYADCNFCGINLVYDWRWIPEEAERTITVARYFKEQYGMNAIEFFDAHFFPSESRTVAIADGLKPLNIAWWGESRIDSLLRYRDSSWKKIRESGCSMIFFGAESGCDEVLQQMDKQQSVEQTFALVRKCKEHGIVPELSFVLGNPVNPEKDVNETIRFIYRVKEFYPQVEILIFIYTPVPQPGMYDQAVADGFEFPDTLDAWASERWLKFGMHKEPSTPWLSRALWKRIRDFETVIHAYYPTATDLRLSPRVRNLLRAMGSWRYKLRFYHYPYELRAVQRAVDYRQPEVEGF